MGWVPWDEAHGWVPLTAGMIVLLVLHVRWFLELCHMGATFIRSGIIADSTERIPEARKGDVCVTGHEE